MGGGRVQSSGMRVGVGYWCIRWAAAFVRAGTLALALAILAGAQAEVGTIRGTVSDPAHDRVAQAAVTLDNALTGRKHGATTDAAGQFEFDNVPQGSYRLLVEAPGFQTLSTQVSVRSNVPLELELGLDVGARPESVTVQAPADLVQQEVTRTETVVDQEAIARLAPEVTRRDQLQAVVSSTPGWSTENDGLMHVRGVDDGALYVVDGIPIADRVDSLFSSAIPGEAVSSLDVISGNIPAEFGDRSGAVVVVQPKTGLAMPLQGTVALGAGTFRSGALRASAAGGTRRLGFYFAGTGDRSDRYLDPVDPRNFHDSGGSVSLFGRADWHPTGNDVVLLDLSADGSNFDVPNTLAQQIAGQRQRQRLRDNHQAVSWQHTWSARTLTNLAIFHHHYRAELSGSPFDTPLFAFQQRHHSRIGGMASVTHAGRGHTIKLGGQATRVSIAEFFSFAVTNVAAADEAGLSAHAESYTPSDPFVFRGDTARALASSYAQDDFSPVPNLTVNLGVRYDYSDLLVSKQQLSPRVGAVYYFKRSRTAVRASVNRLYMPPQVENLLLASSAQARSLSPFSSSGGGAAIPPERMWAYEAGVSQELPAQLRLSAAYWWRSFRNIDDPNLLFSTTIIFPNSVARAHAQGLDARLDVPQRHGWSAYLSYSNSRITEIGPLNGGLFLTDDFLEIGPDTRFTPDHDQRNVGSFAVSYTRPWRSAWASFSGRYESGVPLDLPAESLPDLSSRPGAGLVNFGTGRVKPWAVLGMSGGMDLLAAERVVVSAAVNVQNLTDRAFVFNFGNPFSGTHFGYPRMWAGELKFRFR
jgi:hypothetical protein